MSSMKWLLRLSTILLLVISVSCTSANRSYLSETSLSSEPLIGKVVWNDLMTEDIDSAQRFYGSLFGWTFEESTTPDGKDYVLARSGNVYVAGFVPIAAPPDGTHHSRWLPFVSVRDVDQAVSRSESAGGNLAASARDVKLGRVAAIADPEGAVIGFARSSIGDPHDAVTVPGPGRVVWTELLADDMGEAAEFYRFVIGCELRVVKRRNGEYTFLNKLGIDRAGILQNPSDAWSPIWLTYFGVENVAAAAANAESLGGQILLESSPNVRENSMAVVEDPTGALLVLQRWPMDHEG